MSRGMPLPQGDKTMMLNRKVPATGPDMNDKTKQAGRETAPKLPERDGPAKGRGSGKVAGKPPTSAKPKTSKRKIADMKSSLAKMK